MPKDEFIEARSARGTADFAEWLDASDMFKAGLNEACETLEAVRIDGGTGATFRVSTGMIVLALKSGITFMRTRPGGLTTLFHRHQNKSCPSILELSASPQILLASLLCGEVGLKLTKRPGERRATLYTLPIGAC